MISSQIQTWLPMTLFVFCVFFGCYWKRYWLFFLVIRSLKFGYCDIVSSRPQSLKTKAVCWHAYLFLSTSWTTNGFILTSLWESRSAASRRGAGVFSRAWKTKALSAIAVGPDHAVRLLISTPCILSSSLPPHRLLWDKALINSVINADCRGGYASLQKANKGRYLELQVGFRASGRLDWVVKAYLCRCKSFVNGS